MGMDFKNCYTKINGMWVDTEKNKIHAYIIINIVKRSQMITLKIIIKAKDKFFLFLVTLTKG